MWGVDMGVDLGVDTLVAGPAKGANAHCGDCCCCCCCCCAPGASCGETAARRGGEKDAGTSLGVLGGEIWVHRPGGDTDRALVEKFPAPCAPSFAAGAAKAVGAGAWSCGTGMARTVGTRVGECAWGNTGLGDTIA